MTPSPISRFLNSNNTIKIFLNTTTGGVVSFNQAIAPFAVGSGAVAMTSGSVNGTSLPDLIVVNSAAAGAASNSVGVLANTSIVGGSTVTFGPFTAVGSLAGVPVGVATGFLSTTATNRSQDIAVVYEGAGSESMVAVFRNIGNLNFLATGTFDALQTNPTSIAVLNLSGGAWQDIVVTNNDPNGGTVSVFQPAPSPPTNGTTTFFPGHRQCRQPDPD